MAKVKNFSELTEEGIRDVASIIWDNVGCSWISDILVKHGYDYQEGDFLVIEPEDDKELSVDVYNRFFA